MKKAFFAVTVCTLAIAAASSTMANSKVFSNGYILNTTTQKCTTLAATDCGTGSNACVDGGGNQVYALNNNGGCITALVKQ